MAKRRTPATEPGIQPAQRRYKDILDRGLVRDARLSLRALGVAVRLLSNAPGYRMTSLDLAAERPTGEGRDAVRSALAELERAGYLLRTRIRLSNGQCVTQMFITDEAAPAPDLPSPAPGNPSSAPRPEKPAPGFPAVGTPVVKSSKSSSSRSSIRRTTTTKPEATPLQELAWPPQLDDRDVVVVGSLIERLELALQQQVLDELQGTYNEGKPPIRLSSWVRAIVRRAEQGEFVPDRALRVAKDRARRSREAMEAASRRELATRQLERSSDPKELERRRAKLVEIEAQLRT